MMVRREDTGGESPRISLARRLGMVSGIRRIRPDAARSQKHRTLLRLVVPEKQPHGRDAA